MQVSNTVKLGDKERFDKEQIGVKEPFSVTNCQFTSLKIWTLELRNNFRVTEKFIITKFDCIRFFHDFLTIFGSAAEYIVYYWTCRINMKT